MKNSYFFLILLSCAGVGYNYYGLITSTTTIQQAVSVALIALFAMWILYFTIKATKE